MKTLILLWCLFLMVPVVSGGDVPSFEFNETVNSGWLHIGTATIWVQRSQEIYRVMPDGTTIITIYHPSHLTGCSYPDLPIQKNHDGTYSRPKRTEFPAIACFTKPTTWQEEWTNLPENGGTFIRRLEEKAP